MENYDPDSVHATLPKSSEGREVNMLMPSSPAEQWYALWDRGEVRAELGEFLAGCGDVPLDELVDLLLVDQQLQWRDGPGPRVEEYLDRFPIVSQHQDALTDLVYGEWRARRKLGFQVDPGRLAARFPQIADRLEKQSEVANWLPDVGAEEGGKANNLPTADADNNQVENLTTGKLFGDYELLETIARGGMGIVFKARHRTLGRIVALKMIPPERLAVEEEIQRFQVEVLATSQLDHPNIIPVYEVGQCKDMSFFTTRFVETGSLADNVDRFQGKPPQIARLVRAIASAVHHANERGVLHRDLKPSNVLIAAGDQPLVTDFGLARILNQASELTRCGDLLGSPAWLAPELASRKPGAHTIASEVYGLGAILYFLLTGQAPFQKGDLLETLARVHEQNPLLPRRLDPGISRDLEMICLKAMDKDPLRRYATADLMAQDLDRFLCGQAVLARPLPWWEMQRRWGRRHPLAASLTFVCTMAVVLLLVTAAYYTAREGRLANRLNVLVTDAQSSKEDADRLQAEASIANLEAHRSAQEAAATRAEAIEARRDHRLLLYAAHIKAADEALREHDIRQANDLLLRQIPRPGLRDLRGFEWFWLRRQCQIGGPELNVAMHNPCCVRFSPDGHWLAVGDSQGRITLFEARTQQRSADWMTSHETVESVSFSPTSKYLATAGYDGTIKLWNLETKAVDFTFNVSTDEAWRAEFVDETRLVAASGGDTLLLLDSRNSAEQTVIPGSTPVMAIGASPDQGLFAALGNDGVTVFDLETLERCCFIAFDQPKPGGNVLRFSPTGKRLAYNDGNRNVYVYELDENNAPTPILVRTILDEIQDLSFSQDAEQLAVGSNTGGVHLWSLNDAHTSAMFEGKSTLGWQAHAARLNSIAFSPTSTELASAGKDDQLRIWRPIPTPLISLVNEVTFPSARTPSIAFAPNGQWLAGPAERGIQRCDVDQMKLENLIDREGQQFELVAISPDGMYLAAAGNESGEFVEVWKLSRRSAETMWQLHGQGCRQLIFAPDSRTLAVVDGQKGQTNVLDAATGRPITTLTTQEGWSASFSPDGSHLAVTVLDHVNVWECSTWKRVYQLLGHRSTTTTVTYSPDGQWIASGSSDRSIRLWDMASGKERFRMLGHRDGVEQLAFSRDGQSLVSTSRDGTIKVWHVASGEFLCELWKSYPNRPVRLASSPNGAHLAVRLENGEIALLDTAPK